MEPRDLVLTRIENGTILQASLSSLTLESLQRRDSSGWTPLHYAAQLGHLPSLLPYCGFHALAVANEWGITPLSLMAVNGTLGGLDIQSVPLVHLERKDKLGRNFLHYAALKGFLDQVEWSGPVAAILSTPDNDKNTPLHLAATYGHMGQIPFSYLPSKAMLAPDRAGRTPLSIAIAKDHPRDWISAKTIDPYHPGIRTELEKSEAGKRILEKVEADLRSGLLHTLEAGPERAANQPLPFE